MLRRLRIIDGKIVENGSEIDQLLLYTTPDETEKKYLVETLRLDEHTLNSALDPDELARLEFEPEHAAMIVKQPRHYSAEDQFFFKVLSVGVFLFKDKLVLVMAEDVPLFEGKHFAKVGSLQDIVLKLIYRSIFRFEEHLRVINMISLSLEQEINKAMENKHLISLFTLEKSLVYYLNGISSNLRLTEKAQNNAAKLSLTPENLELLDDIVVENKQCLEQAQIYSNILASLMDARASIVANNLNVLMKTLNIIMLALMLPMLVVSIFSMNVALPLPGEATGWPFWFILSLALASAMAVGLIWWKKKL